MGTRTVSVLSLLALSLNATVALAAEPSAAVQPYGNRDEETIDLSNAYEPEAVFVTSVAARLDGGNVTGSFVVENTEDTLVTGLQYRLELRGVGDEDGLPYMIDVVRASVALAPSENKTLLFASPLPNVPAGRYDMRVQLLTAKGRSLGWMDSAIVVSAADASETFVKLLPGTIGVAAYGDELLPPLSGPNVEPSSTITLRGLAVNDGSADIRVKPVVELFDFNAARVGLNTYEFATVRVAAGESIPLDMNVVAEASPGVYMAHVTLRDADTNETISTIAQYRYVVKGEDADIVSITLDNMGTKAGDWAYGTIDLAGSADALTTTTATLRVQLTDAAGVLGSIEVPNVELTDAILSAKIRIPLERDLVGNPTVEASLLSESNATYDHAVYAGTLTPAQLAGLTTDQSVSNWVAWHGMARISLFTFLMALIGYGLFSLGMKLRGRNGVAFARTAMAAFLLVCFAAQTTTGFAAGSGGIEVLTPKNGSEVFAPLGNAPIVALFINSPVHNQQNNLCNRQVTLSYRVDYGVCENQIANVRVLGRVSPGHLTSYDPSGAQWQTVHDKPFISDLCTQHVCFATGNFTGTIDLTNALPANTNEATLQLVAKYGKNIAMPDSSFLRSDQFITVGWAHALNVHMQCEPQVGCVDVLKEGFDSNNNRITTSLPNFTFRLDGNQTVTTNAAGQALFSNVTPGQHTITENSLSGWTNFNVTPANGVVQVQSGNNCAAVVFKNRQDPQVGCVEILKEGFDAQNNRITTALPNFTFRLDNNQTITTDAQGRAVFQNVTPGTHTVTENALAGWTNFNVTPANGSVNVTAGTNCAAVVFKNRQVPQVGCVEILKEGFDAQNNRITTALPNFTFRLDNNQTITTDAQGRAVFQNVTPGTHTVTENPLAGWTLFNTTPTNGSVNVTAGTNCAAVVFKNRLEPTQADLQIQKTGPQSIVRGTNAAYTLTVKNNGPASAPNVIVGDPLPAGTTFVAASSDNRCTLQGNTVFCNLGTMTANQQMSVAITLNVPNANPGTCAAGSILNRAAVQSDLFDPTIANNEASFTSQVTCPAPQVGCIEILKEGFDAQNNRITTALPNFTFRLDNNQTITTNAAGQASFQNVAPGTHTVTETPLAGWTLFNTTPTNGSVNVTAGTNCAAVVFKNRQNPTTADLQIQKTGPTTAVRGATLQYQFIVKNNGQASATNVIVGDPLPTGTTFVAASSDNRCQLQGTTVFCALGTMTSGQQIALNITVQSTLPTTCTAGTILNRAAVQSDLFDPTIANNEASFTTQMTCPAPQIGCIEILKEGFDAGGVRLTTVPSFTFKLDGGETVHTDNTGRARFSSVTPGNHIVTEVTASGWTLFNTTPTGGTVNVASGQNCAAVVFKNRQVPQNADVSVVKSGPQTAVRGGNITYSLTVTNTGPAVAQNVVVDDVIPQGLTTPVVSGQNCAVNNGTVRCTIGTMAVGEQRIITINLQVPSVTGVCQTGSVTNTATLTATNDTTNANNTSAVTTQLQCPTPQQADMQITKTGPTPNTVVRGQNIAYALLVKNNGPSSAPNVIVGDPLPTGTTFVASASDNRCTLSGAVLFCNLGTMTSGQQISVPVTLNVTQPSGQTCVTGQVLNQAAVLSDLADPNTQNNQSSVTTPVTCPSTPQTSDVSIQKTGPSAVTRGENFSYTLSVTNSGPGTATGVVITDPIPSGLVFVSSANSECTLASGTVTCQVGTLTANQTRSFVITVNAPTIQSCAQASVTNTATVTRFGTDGNTGNNTSAITTQINCPGTLVGCIDIIKETYDTNGNVLTPVTQFTFGLDGIRTATNGSDGRARFENVTLGTHTVTETLPTNWIQQSVTPQNGVVNVVAGSCATVTFKNRQSIATGGWSITKTDNETEVEPGDTLTYRITVRNLSSTRQTNITVRDTLPEEVIFEDASPNETNRSGRVILWENQTFEANETKTYEVEVEVDDDADGTLLNTADVQNVTATDRTDIEDDDNDEDVEIDLTKTASTSEVFPGGIIDYTVRIENTGDGTIKDLVVTDNLPADVIIIDDGDADSRSGRRLEWEIDELEEGDEEIFRYRVSVPTYMVSGQIIRNEVCVESDDFDEECESVTVSVLGIIPTTGAAAPTENAHLKPVSKKAPTSDGSLPFLAVIALAGVATGAGAGFGRKMLFGI